MAEDPKMQDVNERIKGTYQNAQGISVDKIIEEFEKSTIGAMKGLAPAFGNVFKKSADTLQSGIGPETAKTLSSLTGTLSAMSKMGGTIAAAALTMAKGVADLLLNVVNRTNALWKTSMNGVEATLRGMNVVLTETLTAGLSKTLGPITGPKMAGAIGGFLDTVITSMKFRFEEGLKYRQTKQGMEAQMGTGASGSSASSAMKYSGALGRDEAAQWGQAVAGVGTGAEDFDKVLNKTLQIGKTMGLNADAAANLQQSYVSFGNSGVQAGNKIEQNLRKIQAAAKDTGLSVSMMSGYITDAATQARKFNVDVGLIGNTMAMLASQSKNLGAFGVDMKIHGGQIMKDFATGGSKMDDAMHMYFGSKGGTEDIGLKAWTKSKFGEVNAESLKATSGGGFSMASSDKNMMMVNKLEMMKDAMIKAAASASNVDEALMIQSKVAKDLFGMSEEAATTLATSSTQGLEELAKDPAMAASFKDTNQLLGELQNLAAKDQQIQRELVKINMKQLAIALEVPDLFQNLGLMFGNDNDRKKGKEGLGKVAEFTKSSLMDMFDSGSNLGKIMKSLDPETFDSMNIFAKRIAGVATTGNVKQDEAINAQTEKIKANLNKNIPNSVEKQNAEGGLLHFAEGGKLPHFRIGERGPEDLYPGGFIQSNSDLRDMEREKQKSNQGININLYVSGQTKQQMKDLLGQEIDRQFA